MRYFTVHADARRGRAAGTDNDVTECNGVVCVDVAEGLSVCCFAGSSILLIDVGVLSCIAGCLGASRNAGF
jgi:hypothetical protein